MSNNVERGKDCTHRTILLIFEVVLEIAENGLMEPVDCAAEDAFVRANVNRPVTDALSAIQINGIRHPALV